MKAIILVGGEGTRLRPLTYTTPKAMVPVLNRPYLAHLLAYLTSYGVDEVALALGYLPDRIQAYFGAGEALGLRLIYSVEAQALGTAGAARLAAGRLGVGSNEPLLVLNGDIFTDLPLDRIVGVHRAAGASVTIGLVPVADPSQYGVVKLDPDGRIRAFIEKPAPGTAPTNLINAGIYVLDPAVLELVPPDTFYQFEQGLFPALLDAGAKVCGLDWSGYWIDIGTPEKYRRLNFDLLSGAVASPLVPHIEDRQYYAGADCVTDGAAWVGPVVLGCRCRVGRGAEVGESVIWDDVEVGPGARVIRSVIGRGSRVGPGAVLEDAVVGDNVEVGAGVCLGPGTRLGPGEVVAGRIENLQPSGGGPCGFS